MNKHSANTSSSFKGVVLYVCSEDWYFRNHRLDHAKALINSGFEVHVATRLGSDSDEIARAGCKVHEFNVERGFSISPNLFREAISLDRIVRRIRPDIVHSVALKMVGISLSLLVTNPRSRFIFSINGLGVSASEKSLSLSLLTLPLRVVSRFRRVVLLFQNEEDRKFFQVSDTNYVIIPGVGVDLEKFQHSPVPPGPPWKVVFLGRSVRSKGLLDLAAAAQDPRIRAADIHFELYCTTDLKSPGSLSESELSTLSECDGITLYSHTQNPSRALKESHLAILASHGGEGVSKFLLEAMASGRPVIASRSPGSDVLVLAGETGWTFEPGNIEQLIETLVRAISQEDHDLESAGTKARKHIEKSFDVQIIAGQIVDLHQRLLNE